MLSIAKSVKLDNENINVRLCNAEIGVIDPETKTLVRTKKKELEFTIEGTTNNEEYSLHFIISKPVSEYYNIEKYEKASISKSEIVDNYLNINDKTYLDMIIDVDVLRFEKSLTFVISFKDGNNEIYGNAEFDVTYDTLETSLN